MMRKFILPFLTTLTVGAPFVSNAQQMNQNAPNASAIFSMKSETPQQLRLEFLNILKSQNLLDKSFDGADLSNGQVFKEMSANALANVTKKLAEVESNTQNTEGYRLRNVMAMLQSASCLEEQKSDRLFVKQKDLDGNDIVAYPLDSLRTNARYGLVENYREGFARIKKDQVFGFLNLCGDEVIPCQYETSEPFNGGKALVKKVVWYFIDGTNNETDVLTNVVDAKALTQGVSLVKFKDNKYAFINNKYDETKKPISNLYDDIKPFFGKEIFKVKLGNLYGLINLQGQVLLNAAYDFVEPSGVAHLYRIGQSGKIGLLDSLWKIKFDPNFSQILDFDANGLAIAQSNGQYCLLSSRTYKSSKFYKYIAPFNKFGLAQIQDDAGLIGLINTDLNVIFEPRYTSISDFNDLVLAAVSNVDRKFGFINGEGKEVIKPQFDEVGKFNKFGLVLVKEDFRDGKNKLYKVAQIYNHKGMAVITKDNDTTGVSASLTINYDFVDTLMNGKYLIAKKTIDGDFIGHHIVDMGAYRLLTKVPYTEISEHDEQAIFRYKYQNRWGMMDTTGKVVLQPTYMEIKTPGEGYYAVLDSTEKYGFIDKRGKIQIPFEYNDVKSYKKGHCVVTTKGRQNWGLINKFNAKVVPCYFRTVNMLEDRIEMTDDKGNKFMIDEKGDCVDNCPKFEEIRRKANATGK